MKCLSPKKKFIKRIELENYTHKNTSIWSILSMKLFTKIVRCVHPLSLYKVLVFQVPTDKLRISVMIASLSA